MNGSFIPWEKATSHVISQGLHYASAVFEGERAYNGKIFKSKEHTLRLFNSAKIIGMIIPYTENEINIAKDELIKKNNKKVVISDLLFGEEVNKWACLRVTLILM